MFVMIMYVPASVIHGEIRRRVTKKAQEILCEGFRVGAKDVKVILECVEESNCNARVSDVFFPIMYLPKGTPYEAKKRTGKMLYDGLLELFPNKEMQNVYLHMKEHDLENYSVNGANAYFDLELKNRIYNMQESAQREETV